MCPTLNKNQQTEKFFLTAVLFLAFSLRYFRLGAHSLWLDEIFTAGRVNTSFLEMVRDLRLSPFPPLYYLLVKLSTLLGGVNEFSLRFPSMIFSVLGVYMIYQLGKRLFDPLTGLIASLLVAISCYNINYAQEAKMYSMPWFFIMAAFFYLIRWLDSQKIRDLWLYSIFAELLIYTSYHGLVFLVLQNVCFLFYAKHKRSGAWWIAQIIILAFYLPWMIFCLEKWRRVSPVSTIAWIPPQEGLQGYASFFKRLFLYTLDLADIRKTGWFSDSAPFSLVRRIFVGFYLTLLSLALIRIHKVENKIRLALDIHAGEGLTLLWIFAPIIFYFLFDWFYRPILIFRYMGFIHLPLLLLVAKALARMKFKTRIAGLVFIICLALSSNLTAYFFHGAKVSGEDWRGAGKFLSQEIGEDSIVALSRTFFGPVPGTIFKRGFTFYYPDSPRSICENARDKGMGENRDKKYYLIIPQSSEPKPVYWSKFDRIGSFEFQGLQIIKYRASKNK